MFGAASVFPAVALAVLILLKVGEMFAEDAVPVPLGEMKGCSGNDDAELSLGDVSAIHKQLLVMKNFHLAESPAAFFHFQKKGDTIFATTEPDSWWSINLNPVNIEACKPLSKISQTFNLSIPHNIDNYEAIAVIDYNTCKNYGHLQFQDIESKGLPAPPADFVAPTPCTGWGDMGEIKDPCKEGIQYNDIVRTTDQCDKKQSLRTDGSTKTLASRWMWAVFAAGFLYAH